MQSAKRPSIFDKWSENITIILIHPIRVFNITRKANTHQAPLRKLNRITYQIQNCIGIHMRSKFNNEYMADRETLMIKSFAASCVFTQVVWHRSINYEQPLRQTNIYENVIWHRIQNCFGLGAHSIEKIRVLLSLGQIALCRITWLSITY